VPGFALNLVLGEVAGLVLGGHRVSSQKIQKQASSFEFPGLERSGKRIFSSKNQAEFRFPLPIYNKESFPKNGTKTTIRNPD